MTNKFTNGDIIKLRGFHVQILQPNVSSCLLICEGILTSMFTDLCLQKHVTLDMPFVQKSMEHRKVKVAIIVASPSLSPPGPQDLCFLLGGSSAQCPMPSWSLQFVWHGYGGTSFSFTVSQRISASSLSNPGASKPRLAEGQLSPCTRILKLHVVTTG